MMQKKLPQRPKQKKSYVLLLCLLSALFVSGCSTRKVQTVKIEAEANQIIDILHEYHIKADKEEIGEGERKTFEIWIDGGDEERAAAIQLMEDHCLGQPLPEKIEGGTVVTSIGVEKAREQRRMKMDIESQLRQIPGATCASVTFVPPEDRTMSLNPYPSTASVLVNYKTPTFPFTKEDIAGMVAKSVPALKAENVSVVLAAKPLRSLPDIQSGYQFRRMALVTGIGSAIILAFVAIVFFLQKQRKQKSLSVAEGELEIYENEDQIKRTSLLDDVYDSEDDDDDGIRLS
ncbi:MAG TPA: hypothetical protein VNI60_09800 [Pyrinomonadaceae bacterium]|nr:hypothetical protein [Pyrinomonadaceae bacterium]